MGWVFHIILLSVCMVWQLSHNAPQGFCLKLLVEKDVDIYCSALGLFYCQYLRYPCGNRIPSVTAKQELSIGSVIWYPGMYLICIWSHSRYPFGHLSHLACFMLRSGLVWDKLHSFAVHESILSHGDGVGVFVYLNLFAVGKIVATI